MVPPSDIFRLLIPLVKTLILVIRINCIEEFLLASKLNKINFQNEVKLAGGCAYIRYGPRRLLITVFSM